MPPLLQQLRNRGRIHDVSHFEELESLLERQSVTFYCGFDPTANSLHIGSMLPLVIMRRLQQSGHKPIVILGSATGLIGDPSGKSEERKLLSVEEIRENTKGIERQIGLFLEKKGESAYQLVDNNQWLGKLNYLEFLRDIGKHFSVNQMIAKDSVRSRLENREQGISYTEFSYMLLQAYDFCWLHENFHCQLQVGGSDQWGNITAGIDLIRHKHPSSQTSVFGLTFALLTTASGSKFGKTEKGAIWLDKKKTSPYHFYQYWLNVSDQDVIHFLKLFTEMNEQELKELEESTLHHPELREAQKRLANDLTALVHGEAETNRVTQVSKILFGEKIENIDSSTLLDIFSEVPSTKVAAGDLERGLGIPDLLIGCALAKSKGEARRLIESGGIYFNNERVSPELKQVPRTIFIDDAILVIRSGKKNYHLVHLISAPSISTPSFFVGKKAT